MEEYMNLTFENKKQETLENIVDYLNHIYDGAHILLIDNEFVIKGDAESVSKIRKDLDDMLNFAQKR